MDFGKKIKKLRKEKRLSKKKLGNELNVSRKIVSKWESNKLIPDTEILEKIADFFCVKTDYLINAKDEELSKKKKKRKKRILIILGILLLIYMISFIYKFIALTIFNNRANSISEDNYCIQMFIESQDSLKNEHYYGLFKTEKDHNALLIEQSLGRKEKEFSTPDVIVYINLEKNIGYRLLGIKEEPNSDKIRKYTINQIDDDKERYFETNEIKNKIKYMSEEKLNIAINPFSFVDFFNKTIKTISVEDGEIEYTTYKLNEVYLIDEYKEKKNQKEYSVNVIYDYVPEHFNNNLSDPMENEETANKVTSQTSETYIGILYNDIDEKTIEQYPNAKLTRGLYIIAIETSSPAENAGLQNGDIIIAIDGTEIKNTEEFKKFIDTKLVGDKINLTIYRCGDNKNIELIIGEKS